MKNKFSSIINWCKPRILTTTLLLLIGIIILIPFEKVRDEKIDYRVNIWQESFDLTRIPNGMVIWKHGVLGTEAEFIHSDTTARYYFFDVGIVTEDKIVHRIRIPYYIMGVIRLGFSTNFREKSKINPFVCNPNYNSYVYHYNN